MGTGYLDWATWGGHGSGLALSWSRSRVSNPWIYTPGTRVCHSRKNLNNAPLLTMRPADFMDGKHNVVLGGSWATHPRIAGRKSL